MSKIEKIATDYKNRFNRQLWIAERRKDLNLYFESRNLANSEIGKMPYWYIIPRTSIWHIPSTDTANIDGWFGIAGDHPTDVVLVNDVDGQPRTILNHFVNKWLRASSQLKDGQDYGDFRIEDSDQRSTIGELIEDRATRLKRWVDAVELWETVSPLHSINTQNDENATPLTESSEPDDHG